jgi:hypothetical protein
MFAFTPETSTLSLLGPPFGGPFFYSVCEQTHLTSSVIEPAKTAFD